MTAEASHPVLGVIADDYTGATDVASALARTGATVRLCFAGLDSDDRTDDIDAVVVALKSRNVPANEAVTTTLATAQDLRTLGIHRLYFKICSTFDSTDAGNIGPVADALLDFVGAKSEIVCPSSPEHGRTVYQGHLFVGSRLLSESSMRHHPLTPMTDPDLVRVLGRQSKKKVSLIPHDVVRMGTTSVRNSFDRAQAGGSAHLIADAVDDGDLVTVAAVAADMPLATGGAGLARLIGEVLLPGRPPVSVGADLPEGPVLVLAGSQSERTGEQVRIASPVLPWFQLHQPEDVQAALDWLDSNLGRQPIMIHSWSPPEDRDEGIPEFEWAMGRLAQRAVERGARRIVVAGGETSGAVVQALGVQSVDVLGEEDRGVPWLRTRGNAPIALMLKSGNFGAPDLLVRAASR